MSSKSPALCHIVLLSLMRLGNCHENLHFGCVWHATSQWCTCKPPCSHSGPRNMITQAGKWKNSHFHDSNSLQQQCFTFVSVSLSHTRTHTDTQQGHETSFLPFWAPLGGTYYPRTKKNGTAMGRCWCDDTTRLPVLLGRPEKGCRIWPCRDSWEKLFF